MLIASVNALKIRQFAGYKRIRVLKAAVLCCLLLSALCPRPRHEFFDAAVWPSFGDLLHDVGDVGEGLDAVQFAAFDDGVDASSSYCLQS